MYKIINTVLIVVSLILVCVIVVASIRIKAGKQYTDKPENTKKPVQEQKVQPSASVNTNTAVAEKPPEVFVTWAPYQIIMTNNKPSVKMLEVPVNATFIFQNADLIPYTIKLSTNEEFTLEPRSYKEFKFTTPQTITFTDTKDARNAGKIVIQ